MNAAQMRHLEQLESELMETMMDIRCALHFGEPVASEHLTVVRGSSEAFAALVESAVAEAQEVTC